MADKHISRREMLRNAALVGVGAWAVPVLTSLPAHAATQKNPCKHVPGNCDVGFTQCGSCGGLGSDCFEVLNKKGKDTGKTVCSQNFFCGDPAYPQCASQKDCAKGTVCTTNGGCTGCTPAVGFCSPKCKGGSIRRGARRHPGGRRTMASV